MSEADEILTIDVVSDVVCPWCYLGEKRLEAALTEDSRPVAVRWRPYQLDPTIPEGGLDRAEYMEKKFGKSGRLQSVHDNLTRLGAELGLPFAFDKIKRSPNTLDAHRLIRWAASAGAQAEVADRLFRAYFVEGRDIGDRAVLVRFIISDITATSAHFEQAFSGDGGKSWEVNWVATDTRIAAPQ